MRLFAALIVVALLSGCAGLANNPGAAQLPVQYATLKVIETSDDITAQDVLERVERARAVLDTSQNVNMDTITSQIDLSGLTPSDKLLVSALLSQIEYAAKDVPDAPKLTRLETVLDWVEQAVTLANPNT